MIFYCLQFVCVFFLLNNSVGNKWFDFKIPFWNVYIIIPCLTSTRYLKPIMSKFFWPWVGHDVLLSSFNGFKCEFKLKTMEVQGVDACSVACRALGGGGRMGLRKVTSINYSHKLAQNKTQGG